MHKPSTSAVCVGGVGGYRRCQVRHECCRFVQTLYQFWFQFTTNCLITIISCSLSSRVVNFVFNRQDCLISLAVFTNQPRVILFYCGMHTYYLPPSSSEHKNLRLQRPRTTWTADGQNISETSGQKNHFLKLTNLLLNFALYQCTMCVKESEG